MGGKLTQAPATPELVERLRSRSTPIYAGAGLRTYVVNVEPDALCQEAADALEAQQARIAELEAERDDFQRGYRHWSMIADQRLGASNRSLSRAREAEALADRYEKALREIAEDHACGCVPCVGQCTSQAVLEVTVDAHREISRQALSSRHEGGEG